MVRKMAYNDTELSIGKITLNLDDLVDIMDNGMVMDRIWDCMTMTDRKEAWDSFIYWLDMDIQTFYDDSDIASALTTLENDLDDDDISDDVFDSFSDQIGGYINNKLYDEFLKIEGSDDEEVYQKAGGDFLDELYDILKGKTITVAFTVNVGGIK